MDPISPSTNRFSDGQTLAAITQLAGATVKK
jgi:hypothetical protein